MTQVPEVSEPNDGFDREPLKYLGFKAITPALQRFLMQNKRHTDLGAVHLVNDRNLRQTGERGAHRIVLFPPRDEK